IRHSSESFPSFPCIDEVRALPHVAGFPDLGVLRPAPTAARPPTPLPGFAGYRRGIASRHPAGDGAETALPSSQNDHPHVQRPIRRRVPQRLAPGTRTLSMAFAVSIPARHPLGPTPRAGESMTTLTQLHSRCRPHGRSRPAPHPASRPRTGASLPGTQASPRTGLTPAGRPELVAPLRHVDHPFFTAPEQSRRTSSGDYESSADHSFSSITRQKGGPLGVSLWRVSRGVTT